MINFLKQHPLIRFAILFFVLNAVCITLFQLSLWMETPHEESYLSIIDDILIYFCISTLYQIPQIIFIAITLPRDFTQYFIKFLCVYTIVSFAIAVYCFYLTCFLYSNRFFQTDFFLLSCSIICGLYYVDLIICLVIRYIVNIYNRH